MNKIKIFAMFMICIIIASCDSNKSKVEEQAKQFVAALNGHDKATLNDLYKDAMDLKNMSFPDSIQSGEITVEKDSSNNYIATIANPRQQKIMFNVSEDGQIKILKVYSILELDSTYTELAVKTGCPMKKLDDVTLSKLLKEDGDYIKFLNEKYSDKLGGNLIRETGQWQSQGGMYPSVTVYQPIRNDGDMPINGSEYNVEFYYYSPNGTASSQTSVQDGVDLQPGEAYTYIVSPGSGYYNACMAHDFNWYITFTYKNQDPIQTLLKYVEFAGNEYDEYIKQHSKSKNTKKSN